MGVIKKLKQFTTQQRAKKRGMTVTEYKAYQKELRAKEKEERTKYQKWQITEKYKQKRKRAKSGKRMGLMKSLEMLAGPDPKASSSDPFAGLLTGSPPQKKKRKKKRRKKS